MSVLEKTPPIDPPDDKVIEIRLSDIVALLKRSRRSMLIGAVIGLLLGGLYAFNKPNEYTSQVSVMPEIQARGASGLGSLGSLAGLAGVDVSGLTSLNDAVRPELYPNVLQSAPFALDISKRPVYSRLFKRTELLESFINATNKPSWLGTLIAGRTEVPDTDIIPATGALHLTKQQDELTRFIVGRIMGTYDKKSGMLTISSTMQDPVVAALSTKHALDYLTTYITSYRTEKARQEVDFLDKQVITAKQRYQRAEYALSSYRDQNRSVYLNTAKIEEQRIQAEFLLTQELYNTLSKQLETAKIKVQQDTPVFKILEPAQIPLKKSGPKRTITLIAGLLIGAIIGMLYKVVLVYKAHQTATA